MEHATEMEAKRAPASRLETKLTQLVNSSDRTRELLTNDEIKPIQCFFRPQIDALGLVETDVSVYCRSSR